MSGTWKFTWIAPDGTRVELFTRVGSDGDNFTSTVLDDEAFAAIGSDSGSNEGIPQGGCDIRGHSGQNLPCRILTVSTRAGTWKLEINDWWRQDNGTLNSWSLEILSPVPPPPAPSLAVNDITITEGDSGTVTATFTVTLLGRPEPRGERRLRDRERDGHRRQRLQSELEPVDWFPG